MLYAAAWYLALSAVTVAAFGLDKRAAARGTWRTPERTLHTLELLGGWPGAFLAMRLFRHKRRKPAYWLITAALAAAHAALWALYLAR